MSFTFTPTFAFVLIEMEKYHKLNDGFSDSAVGEVRRFVDHFPSPSKTKINFPSFLGSYKIS